MIKCLSPLKTEQVPIFNSDRDLPEGLLEIKLDKEGAGPCLYEVTNSAGECFVENRGFCQIRPQGYGGGQGEPVPDSIGDSPISPDTPTRPILGTEEVIEVARGE